MFEFHNKTNIHNWEYNNKITSIILPSIFKHIVSDDMCKFGINVIEPFMPNNAKLMIEQSIHCS